MKIRLSPILATAVVVGTLSSVITLYASQAGKAMNEADAALNSTYKATMESLSSERLKGELREVQRAWVTFKEADIKFHSDLYPESKGGLWTNLSLTEQRTKQLQMVKKRTSGDGYTEGGE